MPCDLDPIHLSSDTDSHSNRFYIDIRTNNFIMHIDIYLII